MIKVPGVTDVPDYDHKTAAMLDLVDVFPTVASLANLPSPADVDGIDQSSVVLGDHGPHVTAYPRNISYHQYPACGMNSMDMVRLECNNVKASEFDFMGVYQFLLDGIFFAHPCYIDYPSFTC